MEGSPEALGHAHYGTVGLGHFHLHAWLQKTVDGVYVVSPEFPTGNGKVAGPDKMNRKIRKIT